MFLNPQTLPGQDSSLEIPAFAEIDRSMKIFIAEKGVPGASLAIAHQGRLIFAGGYGYAEKETQTPCTAQSQFRIGSISKFATAICILKLVENRKITLATKAVPFLALVPYLPQGVHYDDRIDKITVEMLLRHTAGFARSLHLVPDQIQIGKDLGIPPEKQRMKDFVGYGLRLPLDSEPGAKWEYSNFNYMVLGAIVEKASGLSFDAFLQKEICAPLNLRDLHVGRTLKQDRFKNEVVYYDAYQLLDHQLFSSVHPSNRGEKVPWSYGGFLFECAGAAGEIVASMPALCRLMSALATPGRTPLLSPASVQAMASPPPGEIGHKGDGTPLAHYYGLGLNVDWYPGNVVVVSHNGGLPGSSTWLKTWETGVTAAMSCNTNDKPQQMAMSMIEPIRVQSGEAIKDSRSARIDLFPKML